MRFAGRPSRARFRLLLRRACRPLRGGALLLLAAAAALALPAPAARAGALTIGGSGTGLGAMRLLAGAFESARPDVRITVVPSLGTGGGIRALADGAISLAVISRPLKDAERARGMTAIEYGRTPFVFATAKKDAPSGFTLQQFAEIYAGRMARWPGGEQLRVILRPRSDSDTAILEGMSPAMRRALEAARRRKGLKMAVTDQESAEAIGRIPGAIGTSTLALILSERHPLRALSVDGVDPSPRTIADGTYPYYKRLYMVAGPKTPAAARQFAAFVRSAEGRGILARTGHWVIGADADGRK